MAPQFSFWWSFFQKAPEEARRARIGVLKISEGCFGDSRVASKEKASSGERLQYFVVTGRRGRRPLQESGKRFLNR